MIYQQDAEYADAVFILWEYGAADGDGLKYKLE